MRWLSVAMIAACGVPAPPRSIPTAVLPAAASRPAPQTRGICNEREHWAAFELGVSEFEIVCPPSGTCAVEVPFHVKNCTGAPITLVAIDDADEIGKALAHHVIDPPLTVEDGREGSQPVEILGQGFHHWKPILSAPSDYPMPGPYATIGPYARLAAVAACKACKGSYGRHGMVGAEGCICGTADADKECRDGNDCQGFCIYDHDEIVAPGLGRPVGRCSALQIVFGCSTRIPKGASSEPPKPLPIALGKICVD